MELVMVADVAPAVAVSAAAAAAPAVAVVAPAAAAAATAVPASAAAVAVAAPRTSILPISILFKALLSLAAAPAVACGVPLGRRTRRCISLFPVLGGRTCTNSP
jgi:hypothetical protein